MNGVYISYSHHDSEFVDKLVHLFDKMNMPYFLDVKDFAPGEPLQDQLHRVIANSDAILAIVSPAGIKSDWMAYEIGYARASNKEVVLYATVSQREIPAFFKFFPIVTSIAELEEYALNLADRLRSAENVITFFTKGMWSAIDLSNALNVLNSNYQILFIAASVYRDNQYAAMLHSLSLKKIDEDVQYLLDNSDIFISPACKLTVDRIEMASPGGFSLRGLGEPLKQLRELIKDLHFRNRIEQQQAELDLIRQRIEILSGQDLSPQQVTVLAIHLSNNQRGIRDLIENGQLLLDSSKASSGDQQRIRKRKKH